MKSCTLCNVKPILAKGRCTTCYAREHYQSNREHKLEVKRAWVEKNKDKVKSMKRNNHYAREYGISLDQYNELLKAQEGKCSICGATDPRHSHKESLIVDHCHKTGAIRGLLCSPCNVALGHFQDSPSLLRTAAAYLEDSQSNGHNRPKQDLPAVACGRLPKAPSKAS